MRFFLCVFFYFKDNGMQIATDDINSVFALLRSHHLFGIKNMSLDFNFKLV